MERTNHDQNFERLKVKIYMFILPIVIIATGVGWTMDFFFSEIPITIDAFLFPILDVWLLLCFIYILLKNHFPRTLEILSFTIVTIVYIIWFANTMSNNINYGSISGGLGEFTNWVPLFFIFVFLIFDQRMALFVSMIIFCTTVVIGTGMSIFFKQAFNLQTYDSLIQFYASKATYIFALYYLQRLKVAFIQKEAIQHLANTDYLTNLPNRRLVEKRMHENIQGRQLFSVILFDIDHFKIINDTYGHDVGDLVLKEFAHLVLDNIRGQDLFARWGGEEFIIIAQNLSGKQAFIFSERIRKLIEDSTFSHNDTLTASFGVTEYRVNERAQDVLKRADVALYLAKENGRNKVEIQL
jgi:diguanylate cyclase (GGDEF)-like protein